MNKAYKQMVKREQRKERRELFLINLMGWSILSGSAVATAVIIYALFFAVFSL